MEDKKIRLAKNVYDDFCAMLDDHKWVYDRHDDELFIETGTRGEDLPIPLIIKVDADRQLAVLSSPIPFPVPEEMRKQLAVAVSCANHGMVDGCFDYNYTTGSIYFRMTTSFRDSLISKEVFAYMVAVSCHTIDEYNDKFLAVVKKEMSFDEIAKFIK